MGRTFASATKAADDRITEILIRRREKFEGIARDATRGNSAQYQDTLQEVRIEVMRLLRKRPDAPEGLVIHSARQVAQSFKATGRWTGTDGLQGKPVDPLRRTGQVVVQSIDYQTVHDNTDGTEGALDHDWWVPSRDREREPVADAFEREWRAVEVRDAVNELPDRLRDGVRMRFWEGLTPVEVGKRLGISSNTATRDWTKRALPALRESLAHVAV